jgi:protoporphyrinogen oxidase
MPRTTHDQAPSENGTAADAPVTTVGIIGAGPAGLTAAYLLGEAGVDAVVLEASDTVGGISRTVERDGWRFDIGGHRFFTKVPAVDRLWHQILPDGEFLLRPRMSRIYYRGRLFDYPLKPLNALRNLGALEAVLCVASYVGVRIRPPADQSHFEGWVAARFGWRLYRTFFKTYTEKVWGVPATTIQADWAAQRIKNLSLLGAIRNAVFPRRSDREVTTLISEFKYPKLGPGMMWEAARDKVLDMGIEVAMNAPVTGIERDADRAVAVHTARTGSDGQRQDDRIPVAEVVSSMPLSELVTAMSPPAPAAVREAAADLRYRDFLTVALIVPEAFSFPDNWIYIHDPEASVGRIQNFGSWSGVRAWGWSTSSTRATRCGAARTRTSSRWPSGSSPTSASSRPGRSKAAMWSGSRRRIPSTTRPISATSTSSAPGSPRRSRTCTRWGATGCTGTTTPTTA